MADGMVETTGAPLGSARGRTVATSSDEVGGKYASLSIRILRSIGAISMTRSLACSMVSVSVYIEVSLPLNLIRVVGPIRLSSLSRFCQQPELLAR